jgi:hypothetical protein
MMQLQYDENLIESAVFICAKGRRLGAPPAQVRRFHKERERLYSILDPDERNSAFFQLNLSWFREWGLERALQDLLGGFPLLFRGLRIAAFRGTVQRSEEGAELFVNGSARSAVIALRAERFADNGNLETFLRHEFTHLSDMLDPAFGYQPDTGLSRHPSQERLIRERYRLLWDITIDGRLASGGNVPCVTRDQHWNQFKRAYGFWDASTLETTFHSLWSEKQPRHSRLLELASDPRGLRFVHKPSPGALCPLCAFPTFHWIPKERITKQLRDAITSEFPEWTEEQGLCNRCFEVYEVARPARLAFA